MSQQVNLDMPRAFSALKTEEGLPETNTLFVFEYGPSSLAVCSLTNEAYEILLTHINIFKI